MRHCVEHAKKQAAKSWDYGFSGDLSHVNEQPKAIKRFLGK